MTTGHGQPVAGTRLKYYAYGEPRGPSGALPTDRQFTGQRSEEAALGSLYDYGARFYSPVLGRFLSADTMVPSPGNPQSLNRYSYASNNPLRYTDPSGHFAVIPLLITGAVGGVVGGGVDLVIQLTVDHKNIRDVNWAEIGGAAAGGFVAGATLGLAPAGASVLGLTLLGGLGSAAGGQASAITQATLERYLGNNQQRSIYEEAQKLGFLDLKSAAIDTGSGIATGLVGTGLGKLFRSTGLLSEAADTLTCRGEVPMIRWEKTLDQPGKWTFRMEGRTIVTDADTFERLIRSAVQGSYEFTESVLLEAIQQGVVRVVEDQTGP